MIQIKGNEGEALHYITLHYS